MPVGARCFTIVHKQVSTRFEKRGANKALIVEKCNTSAEIKDLLLKNATALCGRATTASGKGHRLLLIKFAGVRAVKLRPRIVCQLLSLLRIHSPDCEYCAARLTCGNELRERLEELDFRRRVEIALKREEEKRRKAG
jgi:hypothetical protein